MSDDEENSHEHRQRPQRHQHGAIARPEDHDNLGAEDGKGYPPAVPPSDNGDSGEADVSADDPGTA